MTEAENKNRYPLDSLVQIMKELRGPGGCPWDREQPHESLKRYLVEEAYEVIEAIELKDMYKLREELGDLLLQIVFHAELACEKGAFDINDVVAAIVTKMKERHPHVFGRQQLGSPEEVLEQWEELKDREKARTGRRETLMDVPRGLPALLRAEKVQARAARIGFDWPEVQGAWDKVKEETEELLQAFRGGDPAEIRAEYGDLLFALVNVARFLAVDPEDALNRTTDKFIRRFRSMEQQAKDQGLDLSGMNLQELDKLWEEAKSSENNGKISSLNGF
ncbi:MAG: nucleoside triphosphate pyrophosphohydrolase [Clostridia bacterium]|nr:nucleoside triphosphate pyrophosphohydrolase [Clostridia bacterium]